MSLRIPYFGTLLGACLLLLTPLTQAAETKGKRTARTYPVAQILGYMALTESPAQADKTGENEKPAEEKLIDLIVATVQPESWKQAGGCGRISYEPASRSLLIHQTVAAHDEIADLLAALARLMDVQVALEVRLLTISEACFERVGINFDPADTSKECEKTMETTRLVPETIETNEGLKTVLPKGLTEVGWIHTQFGKAFLTDSQVRELLETAQGDRRTNVMQAPKLTVLNGQVGTVNIAETKHFVTGFDFDVQGNQVNWKPKQEAFELGTFVTIQPTVSADRKSVLVKLKFKQRELAGPVPLIPVQFPVKQSNDLGKEKPPKLTTTFLQQPQVTTLAIDSTTVIPEGQTLLLGGVKMLAEERNEFGPPVLSKIPYLNRMFKTVGYGRETVSMLIMVTPRIIAKEDEPNPKTENGGDDLPCSTTSEPASKNRPTPTGERTQVRFIQPESMEVSWFAQGPDGAPRYFDHSIHVPGRYNFLQGTTYLLRLKDMKNHPGLEVYAALAVAASDYKTEAFLAHSSVPIAFTEEEFKQVTQGKEIVKVIYLPDPQYQELTGSGTEEISSIDLEPGVDPIQKAQRRGSILLVIYMGKGCAVAKQNPSQRP
jgi:hypothetical protein